MDKGSKRKRMLDTSVLVFPNLFTTGNLFCGFYSIISTLKGSYVLAAYLILAAALFDMVDGKVARLVKGVSDFGREYDSLSDLVSFGVAPALLAYMSYLAFIPRLGWLVAFLFVACGALRLARFNIIYKIVNPEYFIGLPIPIAAVTVASAYLFFREVGFNYEKNYIFLALLFFVSFLMVSSITYKSYKKPEQKIRSGFFTNMVIFLLLLITVAVNPDIVMIFLCLVYVFHGIFVDLYKSSISIFSKHRKRNLINERENV